MKVLTVLIPPWFVFMEGIDLTTAYVQGERLKVSKLT